MLQYLEKSETKAIQNSNNAWSSNYNIPNSKGSVSFDFTLLFKFL